MVGMCIRPIRSALNSLVLSLDMSQCPSENPESMTVKDAYGGSICYLTSSLILTDKLRMSCWYVKQVRI